MYRYKSSVYVIGAFVKPKSIVPNIRLAAANVIRG